MSVATLRPAKPVVPFLASVANSGSSFAEPLVRVATGLFLVLHGAQKLFGWFGGYGIDATGQFFAAKLGLPASLALVAGIIEFFGGLLLAAGIATRLVAALAVGLMAVAVVKVHFPAGSSGPTRIRISAAVGHRRALLCHSRRRPILRGRSDRRQDLNVVSRGSIWNGLKIQRSILRLQASRSAIVYSKAWSSLLRRRNKISSAIGRRRRRCWQKRHPFSTIRGDPLSSGANQLLERVDWQAGR